MTADTIGIPLAWLVGGLWLLTTTLAGALGTALYKKLDAMEESLQEIAATAQELSQQSARVDERLSAVIHRVETLERNDERRLQ